MTETSDFCGATLTVRALPLMTASGRKQFIRWLRKQADALENSDRYGMDYKGRFFTTKTTYRNPSQILKKARHNVS